MITINDWVSRIITIHRATALAVELQALRDEAIEACIELTRATNHYGNLNLVQEMLALKSKPPTPEHAGCSQCQAAVDTCAGVANSLRIMAEALERVRHA